MAECAPPALGHGTARRLELERRPRRERRRARRAAITDRRRSDGGAHRLYRSGMAGGDTTPLLEARGLVKRLGGRRVVDGVDLVCREGGVLGLLGPNGAGKTTTLRMLYGFLTPDAGSIRFRGREIGRTMRDAKREIGVCTQEDTFDGDFTVEQNLWVACSYFRPRPVAIGERVAELLDRFELRLFARQTPETLSGGYRRRLMLARAVVHRPRLLFLDEPTTGLDPQARMAVWDLVGSLRAEGLAIVLTTHYMEEAERLSDVVTVLAQGKVVANGTTASVLGDLVGEHVVVLQAAIATKADVGAWLSSRGMPDPVGVLGDWHLPLRGDELAEFARDFPALRYEVRTPTLDDLFLKLAARP